jgi:ABC-2 type transport system permease protein
MIEASPPAAARIIDRGYKHYDGPRLGPSHALWTMVRGSAARAMGIRRPFRAKVLPWLLVIYVYLPVVVLIGLQTQISKLPHFTPPALESIFNRSVLAYVLFAALAAPEMLCTDRRERVLSLYFAAPITRLHYIGAKCAGLVALMLGLTLLPALILFSGYALLANSASDYVRDHAADLGHLVMGGSLFAVYYGLLAMAVSSFTDRRAYAGGAFLGLLLVSSAAGNILARRVHFANHEQFVLVDLLRAPLQTVQWFFDQPLAFNVSGWAFLGVTIGVSLVSLALIGYRYLQGGDQ